MLDEFVEWLKHMAVFMILCEMMLAFSPTKAFKKYIKPFVGLILLLRITVFMIGTVEIDWNVRVGELFEHYEQSVSQYLEIYPMMNEEAFEQNEEKLNDNIINVKKVKVENIEILNEEIGE